jgi:hypothetical protein
MGRDVEVQCEAGALERHSRALGVLVDPVEVLVRAGVQSADGVAINPDVCMEASCQNLALTASSACRGWLHYGE